jgi:hypothetical protein
LKQGLVIPDGYVALSVGQGSHDVFVRVAVIEEIKNKASQDQRAELDELLERFIRHGVPGLPRGKFNGQEGWYPSEKAAGKVRLVALKPWQLRTYGFIRSVGGRPAMIITGVDCSKKADRAKPAVLKAAGNEAYKVSKEFK